MIASNKNTEKKENKMEKKFKVTGKSLMVYQIERADKPSFPMRYLVEAESDDQAEQICKEMAADTLAAVEKYDIDVCSK